MEKANNYKMTLQTAVGMTVIVAVLLLGYISDASEKNDTLSAFQVILLAGSLGCAIWNWIKGAKQYIDFRFQELEKEKSA